MKILIKELVGHPQCISFALTPAELELSDETIEFQAPVNITLRVSTLGEKQVMAEGNADTTINTQCVRCLEPLEMLLSAEIHARYEDDKNLLSPESQLLGTEDELLAYFDGESIDPVPQIREALMLELPSLPLCTKDCHGLCPICGANLNNAPCGCAPAPEAPTAPAAPAWKEALKKIKLEE
ncbi:hypothetical protein CVU37_12845 [candidate division BRC1 bacterium HGW-BRC1-1]|jgi:uncharacterized protein|nr:MAG: hypothetical protein CVU37_12845 [candidate division BRC1 bacterium HGW-BRC1-1]